MLQVPLVDENGMAVGNLLCRDEIEAAVSEQAQSGLLTFRCEVERRANGIFISQMRLVTAVGGQANGEQARAGAAGPQAPASTAAGGQDGPAAVPVPGGGTPGSEEVRDLRLGGGPEGGAGIDQGMSLPTDKV